MKIQTGQTPELPGALAPADHAKPARNAAQWVAKDAPAGQAAPVTVSIAARALARSADIADASDDFDADKVHAVRAAIDRGQFHVDAQAVANKMLANAQEILSRSRA
ncbi:flagellar biosynthesis anti-sigma factor FlgM [Verminephrobacter eiseniae]|uniref:flagellar biosynthesis anti-sigma factor FlgM n=1 Tax=Verminephrobacter eiseniae TaxID=364317 RepID=UPI002236FDFC|nr:flagellar biosynthesis anti-sigma factor FlgM [Verminephrobacter eiseniae]MCW5235142.1 flagellar biosynthesis anti-sigma factor FlgM [Verminephrobacter eiseniae]